MTSWADQFKEEDPNLTEEEAEEMEDILDRALNHWPFEDEDDAPSDS